MEENIVKSDFFEYEEHISQLKVFNGSHPRLMEDRIKRKNWKFDFDISRNKRTFKDQLKDFLLKIGLNVSYQNYRLKEIFRNEN
jgi:hypothetical protein